MKKRHIAAIIFGVLALAMTGFIFYNSLQTGEQSGKSSDFAANIVKKALGFFGIYPKEDTLVFIIRKTAHFCEYALLGGLTCMFFIKAFCNKLIPVAAVAYGALVAITDEFVMQAITKGRGPSVRDVAIDVAGVLVATGILFLIYAIKGRRARLNG